MRNFHRIGIVGCGNIAFAHARALKEVSGFQLVGLCDEKLDAARTLAQETPVDFVSDDLEMWLEAAQIEAAIVCTPPATHREIVCKCLARGVHVLCEKPLAISVEDAQNMRSEAEKANLVLLPAFKFRFCDAIQRARVEIESGNLGEIEGFEIAFCAPVEMRNRWNARPVLSGGGVLMDNGPHAFDLACFLFGEIEAVEARLGFAQKLEVEDACEMSLEMRSGLSGKVELSWTRAHDDEWFLTIRGAKAILQIGWTQSRLFNVETNAWQIFGGGYAKMPAFVAQLRYFASRISGETNAPKIVTIDDGIASVVAVQNAYRSAREGQCVAI